MENHCKKILKFKILFRFPLFALVLCLAFVLFHFPAHALNDSPQTFTLDGKLYVSGSTSPLLDGSATVTVQILNSARNCLLYEEQQTVNTSSTDGNFTIHVGSATGDGKRTVNDPGRSMGQIFQNIAAIPANNVPGQTCAGGNYTPSAGALRYFRLIVTPSNTHVADTLSPDLAIDSVPNAIVAQSLQGLERTSVLQVYNSGATVLTQSNLEALFTTPAYGNLQSILAGNFIKTDSSGASLPSYASDPAGATNGDIWFDTTTSQIKYQTSGGVQTVGAGGGGGGISSLTVGSSMSVNGTVAGTISSPGTIDLSNTGVSSGTYTKVTVDTKGRVTAGTISLVEADIPNLTTPGKVSGNTITAGTISGSAGVNTTGNLLTTGTVSGLNVQATNLRVYNGTNYIQFTAPALAGIVNFTLPDNDGNPGDVLTSNGSGVLSWAAGTMTLAGDVSGPSGATSVDKIKGKAVTAGSVSGQIMIYDGTQWANNVVSGDATMASTGVISLNKVPVSKGGTNATSFGANRVIASNGSGSALTDITCSLNQVLSFDASGYVVCANVSSLSAAILNGGNATGADISIGTNDNNAFNFKTNNTIAMTISQNGAIGIGAGTSASYGLHVRKDIQYFTDTSTHPYLYMTGQTIAVGGSATPASLLSVNGGVGIGANYYSSTAAPTNGMIVEGNVGFGLRTPSSALDISGAMTAQGMSTAPSTSPTNTGRIYYDFSANKFKVSQNGGAYVDLVSASGATGFVNGGNAFGSNAILGTTDNRPISLITNNSTALTISQNGKVGIGTAGPTELLHVLGNDGTGAGVNVKIENLASNSSALSELLFNINGNSYGQVLASISPHSAWGTVQGLNLSAGSASNDIGFMVGADIPGTASAPAMIIKSSGKVGMFDVSNANGYTPLSKLDIGGNVAIGSYAGVTAAPANGLIVSGNVGIGTSSPSSALDVSGALTAEGMSSAPSTSASNTGRIYYDYSANKFKISQNGGAYIDLVSAAATSGFLNGGNAFGSNATLGTTDNRPLSLITNNTTAMTISQNGSVGIGTNLLSAIPLTVKGANGAQVFVSGITTLDPTVYYSVGSTEHNWGGYSPIMTVYNQAGDTTANYAAVNTNAAGSTMNYGFMGVGARSFWTGGPSPVVSGDLLPGLAFAGLTSSSPGPGTVIGAGIFGQVDNTVTSGALPTSLVFHTSATDHTGLKERVRITSGGLVGVGVPSPSVALDVSGAIQATGQIHSSRQTSSAASPLIFDADLGNIMLWTTNTASPTANVYNMKPGGTYTLVVAGTGTGTVTINCYSNAGTTSLPSSFVPTNGARVAGTLNKSVYSLISDGTNCLATWITGF